MLDTWKNPLWKSGSVVTSVAGKQQPVGIELYLYIIHRFDWTASPENASASKHECLFGFFCVFELKKDGRYLTARFGIKS